MSKIHARLTRLRHLGLSALIVAATVAPAAADKTFNTGSLILPTTSVYQSECGAVSVYGLVYNVLRANAYLEKNKVALGITGLIEVHYAYRDTKRSPNRCTPTNISVNPAPATDLRWVDGCDFEVYDNAPSPAPPPVSLVNNVSANADVPISTNDTMDFADGTHPEIYPGYAQLTITKSATTAKNVNRVRYGGAPFIIADTHAATFLRLVRGTLIAKDSQGNNIDLAPFRGGAGACNFGSDNGGYVRIHRANAVFTAPAPKMFAAAPPRLALLATSGGVSATSIDNLRSSIARSSKPGASKVGSIVTITTKSGHGFVVGEWVQLSGVTNAGYSGVFQIATVPSTTKFTVNTASATPLGNSGTGSVTRAGAVHTGTTIVLRTSSAHGLLVGQVAEVTNVSVPAYNGTFTVASVPNSTTLVLSVTPAVAPVPVPSFVGGEVKLFVAGTTKVVSDGILQRYLKNAGLGFTGAGGCPPGGKNVSNPAKCPRGGVAGQIYDTFDFADLASGKLNVANYKMLWTPHWETTSTKIADVNSGELGVITKIASFLDNQTGLMAECQSIHSFEGGYYNGSMSARGTALGQFLTCVASGTGCGANPSWWGIDKNFAAAPYTSTYLPNCSDPVRLKGSQCVYYAEPGDPFAQPGDFSWYNDGGLVDSFLPNAKTGAPSRYKPGVAALISAVSSLDLTKLATPATARTMVTGDYATRGYKDNNTAKGNIVYVAGHDVSGAVAGTKVILQTLLLLGEPPIKTQVLEVTRSSPITSVIEARSSLVQGSFVKITPPPTTLKMNADGQGAAFRFPDVLGHMRAVQADTVTTQQTDFSGPKLIFDAADMLPNTANSYTGCGASRFGAGGGNCRTIFTHTAAGANPPRVVMDQTAVGNTALKAAINLDGGTVNTDFHLLLKRVIAGIEEPAASGTFVPKLGGVDRSTVAIVPSSLVAGVTRPKVAFFGASDGMLHAVCVSVQPGTGCDQIGRELWGFVPRLQLPYLRRNTAKVDGSPRVMDVFGDFTRSGTKSFRTLLMFQTGSGDPATAGHMPSVTALDVTNPFDPTIVWEYALPSATTRGAFETGQGLVLSAGPVRFAGLNKTLAFVHTNNGGTGGVGNVVTAIDMETGAAAWRNAYLLPPKPTPVGRDASAPPQTAIPGGAVYVDKAGAGTISDVVFGTLYGDVWQVDAATGISRHGATVPLFRHSTDRHPFGVSPTIYSVDGGALYALLTSGGYADLAATTLWSASNQLAVALSLSTPVAKAPLTENSSPPYVPWRVTLGAGEKGFGQAIVVGDQILISTDTSDVNDSSLTGYGTGNTNTGHVYQVNVTNGKLLAMVATRGGAGSIQTIGSVVYSVSKDKAERLAISVNPTTGESPSSVTAGKVRRLLWLRSM